MIDAGVYALLIFCPECRLTVGALGEIHFPESYCVYVGSAQRNMQKRIKRHLRRDKKLRWHIDYLLTRAEVVDYFTVSAPKKCEEKIAMQLQDQFNYVSNFGASDSRARSHLFLGEKENLWYVTMSLMKRCGK